MKRTAIHVILSLCFLSVTSLGRAVTLKDQMIENKKPITLALATPVENTDGSTTEPKQSGMLVRAFEATSDNVQNTALRRWAAVSIFDFKHDQWMAGAMTNVALVQKYALHFDVGYAQPLQNAATARGSVLFGASVHLDETVWFPRTASYLLSFVPLVPEKAVGLLQYTTVGGTFGYNFDRSIENNGHYDFQDGAIYGIFIGLQKSFDLGPTAQ